MLSETDPFGRGLNKNKISEMSWDVAHTTKQPQPGCGHIEPQLQAVVMRCLQKAPDERFTTVDELKRVLQAAVAVGSGAIAAQIGFCRSPSALRGRALCLWQ